MKKLNFIFLLSFATLIGLNAQSSPDIISDDINYQLEFVFTGEITSALDSTFIAYCILDASKLKDYDKLIIKSGKDATKLNEHQIELSDKAKVEKKLGKFKIEIGKAGDDLEIIDLSLLKKNGTKVKILMSQNK